MRLLWLLRGVALLGFLPLTQAACAQLQYIDPAKLPQDLRVQNAYSQTLSVEDITRDWSPNWNYETPKKQVADQLAASLHDLRDVGKNYPENEELLLLTGLVAHFAYNIDVDDTYEVAVRSFEQARKLVASDYRPEWFLAGHRCQSNEVKIGMESMLAIEARTPWKQLPVDFWDDYISCSTIAFMPAHTLRAVDHVVELGARADSYTSIVEIAHHRYTSSRADGNYDKREAWQAVDGKSQVSFASELCGIGFSAHEDWRIDIRDVSKGTCIATVESGPYPRRGGTSAPTTLILTRIAAPGETLDEFTRSFLKKYPSARPVNAPWCPMEKCDAFEIVTDDVYRQEGGGHFLVVGFAAQQPKFPGLLFESPEAPPKAQSSDDKVMYYRPTQRLQRFPGTLYTLGPVHTKSIFFE
jgi:hypothetical protein